MRENHQKLYVITIATLFLSLLFLLTTLDIKTVWAADKTHWMLAKKIKTDINYDGKKNTIKVFLKHPANTPFDHWCKILIKVNGKVCFETGKKKDIYGYGNEDINIRVLKLKDGQKFLAVYKQPFIGGITEGYILEFYKGKFYPTLDIRKEHVFLANVKVAGNTLWLSDAYLGLISDGDKSLTYDVSYRYQNGRFRKKTNIYRTKLTYYDNKRGKSIATSIKAKKKLPVYEYPRGKKCGYIKKGDKIKIKAVWIKNLETDVVAYQIQSGNKKLNNKWLRKEQCEGAFK